MRPCFWEDPETGALHIRFEPAGVPHEWSRGFGAHTPVLEAVLPFVGVMRTVENNAGAVSYEYGIQTNDACAFASPLVPEESRTPEYIDRCLTLWFNPTDSEARARKMARNQARLLTDGIRRAAQDFRVRQRAEYLSERRSVSLSARVV